LQQIMENGAMGVQITVSGKLRGDRSAFEKHSVGILPRAGHHADVIVAEDIAHVKTPMGLIGIRVRIARKEKFVPEFELKQKKQEKVEQDVVPTIKDEDTGKITDETKDADKPKTESEQIKIDAEKMKSLETLEDEEKELQT